MKSTLERALEDIQVVLRDDSQENGVVHPATAVASLNLSKQINASILSVRNDNEVKDLDLSAIFQQIQLASAFMMASDDERIKNQLPDLIRNSVKYLLSSNDFKQVWEIVVYPIAVSSLQYIVSHLSRKVVTRSTVLGTRAEIEMDDTTGWEDLELHIKIYQSLFQGCVLNKDMVVSLWSVCVYSESDVENVTAPSEDRSLEPITAWQVLLQSCANHVNRHLRENFYSFMEKLIESSDFQFGLLSTKFAESQQYQSTDTKASCSWLHILMEQLPIGLEDDWTQIRYAACTVLDKILLRASCDNQIVTVESLMQKYAHSILPRLCVNRFHAAPSLQSCSKNVWQKYFFVSPSSESGQYPLGKQLLIEHVEKTVKYFISTMNTARNHMVCEAAIHALSEIILRLPTSDVAPFQLSVHLALLSSLEDDRWPVKDSACLASGRILRRFPPLSFTNAELVNTHLSSTRIQVNMTIAKKFLQHWEKHLVDCIWSVRENAAFACAEALVSDSSILSEFRKDLIENEGEHAIEQWRQMVWTMIESFLETHFLNGLKDVDESVEILFSTENTTITDSTTNLELEVERRSRPIQSRIESFLPADMVRASQERKVSLLQHSSGDELAAMDPTNLKQIDPMPVPASSSSYRKGWGCCVDCVNLRDPFPWEITQGALYVFREVCLLPQRSCASSSCDVFSKEYLSQHEALARRRRSQFLCRSWAFRVHYSDTHNSTNYVLGLFSVIELLRSTEWESSEKVPPIPKIQSGKIKHPVKNLEKLHPAIYEEVISY